MRRIIMHVDFDSFYASLEEQRKPELAGKPVVVCMFSGRSRDSGAVATANYRARQQGIEAGMPIAAAKKLAPDAAFLPADLDYYRAASDRIMQSLEADADSFEQRSIDEAYLDVSQRCSDFDAAYMLATSIRSRVRESEGITCSVGIAPNKLIAKMASRFKKPDGLTVVKPEEVVAFIEPMPVGKTHGIGPKTEQVLHELGIQTIGELASCDMHRLEAVFGDNKARFLHDASRGIDASPVRQEERQQVSRIVTLREDTNSLDVLYPQIDMLAGLVHSKLRGQRFRTVSILVITPQQSLVTRNRTLAAYESDAHAISVNARKLLEEFVAANPATALRRLGVRVANLEEAAESGQKTLASYGI
ncbi:MAG: DNA polymerase IV [Candidatus Aenigmarchaeota archaeon]|nr:DNA polymerase IV [Candidatus Aenigmarchaeota archaeon]